MFKGLNKVLIVLIPLVLMVACSTAPKKASTAADEGTPAASTTDTSSAQTKPLDEAPAAQPKPLMSSSSAATSSDQGNLNDLLAVRVIYFDYDEATIKSEFRDVLAAHAKYLASHPSAHVALQGNCDERGTREYNMGLGERRANSVKKFLSLQGAANKQMESVSFGEERPVASGHDEASWAKNRRVEIVYTSR